MPALGISFDMRGLLRGQIQPTVLTLVRPELRLQRTADGIDVDVQTEDWRSNRAISTRRQRC